MSLLTVNRETFAAGLTWQPRLRGRDLARGARAHGAAAFVETGHQTGFAGDEEGDPVAAASLAAAVHAVIEGDTWVAAILADDGTAALVRSTAGRLSELPGEDRMASADAARILGESAHPIHASPSLGIEGATPLDLAAAPLTDTMRLETVPQLDRRRQVVTAATLIALVAGLAFAGWMYGRQVWEIFFSPPPPPTVEVEVERQVMTVIDTGTFLALCDAALRERPPGLAGWRLDQATCHARLTDAPVLQQVPSLSGRPALVLRWSLEDGHDIEINRRTMEASLLSERHAGQVQGTDAWAVTPLASVIAEAEQVPSPAFLDLRAAVDRRIGAWATAIAYTRQGHRWAIAITGPDPLARFRQAIDGLAGIEVTTLARQDGIWHIAARPVEPWPVLESVYAVLTQPLEVSIRGDGHAAM